METITLQYNQDVKEKLMKFLESFSKKEIQIIEEKDERFEKAKAEAEVHRDYLAYKNNETEFMSLDEFEEKLNAIDLD